MPNRMFRHQCNGMCRNGLHAHVMFLAVPPEITHMDQALRMISEDMDRAMSAFGLDFEEVKYAPEARPKPGPMTGINREADRMIVAPATLAAEIAADLTGFLIMYHDPELPTPDGMRDIDG